MLAFESSADDTGAAIVTSDRRVLSNVVLKQNLEWVVHAKIDSEYLA